MCHFTFDVFCSDKESVQLTCSVESSSLPPHELQHARLRCPSPTPGACPKSCPSSWWPHPLSSTSPPAFSLTQHQVPFQWVSSSHQFSSVQFSRSVVSDSLRPRESQHTRPPCPSPTPGVHSNSSPSSGWCHPTISSSVVPFSSRLQSCPASGSFPISQFFTSGQSTGVSASTSVLSVNIQSWFPLGWTGWISLQSKGLSKVFSNTTVQKHQFFGTQLSLWVQLSHPYMTTGYSQGKLGNTRKYQSCAFSATNMLNCDAFWI